MELYEPTSVKLVYLPCVKKLSTDLHCPILWLSLKRIQFQAFGIPVAFWRGFRFGF